MKPRVSYSWVISVTLTVKGCKKVMGNCSGDDRRSRLAGVMISSYSTVGRL